MATHQSAIKRLRQSKVRAQRNRHYRSMLSSFTKKLRATQDQAQAQEQYQKVSSLLDKMARKHIIHPNKAANQKSRLAKLVNNLAAGS